MAAILTHEQQFRDIVKQTLGRSSLRRIKELIHDIRCVDCYLKPSLLFDHGAVTSDSLQNFVMKLSSQGITQRKLSVVLVGEDHLICSRSGLLTHLSTLDENGGFVPRVMDVSRKIKTPLLLDKNKSLQILSRIGEGLLPVLHTTPGHSDDVPLLVDIPPDVNVTSLFGLCLGYPVVYWYDVGDEDDDRNCLEMVPLISNQVYFNTTEESSALESNFSRNQRSQNKHCIFAFSYPETFQSDIKEHIETWFAKVLQTNETLEKSSTEKRMISFDTEKRILPAVAL